MSAEVDRILDILDVGLQTSNENGYGTDWNTDQCARCQRNDPMPEGDLCAGCRAFLLEDSDDDPARPMGFGFRRESCPSQWSEPTTRHGTRSELVELNVSLMLNGWASIPHRPANAIDPNETVRPWTPATPATLSGVMRAIGQATVEEAHSRLPHIPDGYSIRFEAWDNFAPCTMAALAERLIQERRQQAERRYAAYRGFEHPGDMTGREMLRNAYNAYTTSSDDETQAPQEDA